MDQKTGPERVAVV
jgi:hypothetical protein